MARLVSMLLTEIPRDGTCLEIGVGTGRIALPLARAGVRVVGVDISREMLRRLVLNAGGNPPPIAVADATRLPFRDRVFASAIASHVFHLIPEWTRAIGELMRVVRPAGVVFASRGRRQGTGWEHEVSRRFFVAAGDPPWPPGADTIEKVDEHMRSRGAVVRELTELSMEGSMSIDELLAKMEAGYWSACWSLDHPARVRAAAAARDWARAEFGDLARQRPSIETSIWHAYFLPEP